MKVKIPTEKKEDKKQYQNQQMRMRETCKINLNWVK